MSRLEHPALALRGDTQPETLTKTERVSTPAVSGHSDARTAVQREEPPPIPEVTERPP